MSPADNPKTPVKPAATGPSPEPVSRIEPKPTQAAPAVVARNSAWTTGPAWAAAVFAAISAMLSISTFLQGREEKRLHVEPRVLWDVNAFEVGQDWQFAATNTGGVDVEGYDVEWELVSFPLHRGGLDPRVTVEQIDRSGKRIARGDSTKVRFSWSEDAQGLLVACSRSTGVTEASGPCILGARVTEVFHRAPDFRRFHRARVLVPSGRLFRFVDETGLTQESLAIQRYFAKQPSKLLGHVPVADGLAHAE